MIVKPRELDKINSKLTKIVLLYGKMKDKKEIINTISKDINQF